MGRCFNTEGECRPEVHYMVRLDERLRAIKEEYVDKGKYFVMNRGRQYGKTTTLKALADYLKDAYLIISMDFQEFDTGDFEDTSSFSQAFAEIFVEAFREAEAGENEDVIEPVKNFAAEKESKSMRRMFNCLSKVCETASKPLVLLIDEVDSASNNQVFIDFLALLRKYYLNRNVKSAFASVILAGVYDIKNLKLKIRPESEHQYNSPWNIAAEFKIDMSFSAEQISGMLSEYEADKHTGMDINRVAEYIYEYTSGYPYLVSAICKIIDEDILEIKHSERKNAIWFKEDVDTAVKIMLGKNNTLFDSLTKQLDVYRELHDMLEEIIYQGKSVPFSPQVKPISLGLMFGFLKEDAGRVAIANRIFEMVLLNLFIVEEALTSTAFQCGERDKNQFIKGGKLNMKLVLEKFAEHFQDIYGGEDVHFLERNGRRFFLLYLKPIINGTGNYYLEAQTRDARRTDVIVDYAGEQFIIEMKIWHGNEYNKRGEEQLTEYLDYYHLDKGYMVSFNFNKKKETGVKEIEVGEKIIVEAVV